MKLQQIKKSNGFKFHVTAVFIFMLALSTMILPVLAMTTTTIVTGVQVAASSDWTVSTSAGTVSVTKSGSTSSGCSSTDSSNTSATLTITNTSTETARLSFDYTYSAGTLYIAGTAYTAGGSYSADIASGGTVSVYLISPSGSSSSGTSVLSNFTLTSLSATANVSFGDNITAKIDGESVDTTETYTIDMDSSVTVTASAAADGMEFAWWEANGVFCSESTTLTWSPSSADDTTITAVYMPTGTAVFSVGSSLYYDFGDALTAAGTSGTVTVYTSGTLYSGEGASGYDASTGETSYTITSKQTLIVPREVGDTGELTWASSYTTAPSVYRELGIAEGTTLTVKGIMIVAAKQGHGNPRTGQVAGPYGSVALEGEIIVASGGQLDAFGYIEGGGMVTAQSGSTVRELLEISDFKGGTYTMSIYGSMFPISQYFIQNIQTAYKIEYGATLEAHYHVYMTVTAADYVTYIDDSTNAMFQLTDGYIMRYYEEDDPDNDAVGDRLTMELHGTMNSSSLAIKFSSKTIDSEDFELPIPGNITLQITEDSTFNMKHAYKLLPGAKIQIDEGGQLNLSSGGELYVYHVDDYDNNYVYGNTSRKLNVTATWGDAEVINNGVMTISSGKFYESPSGAAVYGTGILEYNTDTTGSTTITEGVGLSGSTASESFSRVTLDGADGDITTVSNTDYKGTEDGIWYTTNGSLSVVENITTTIEDNQIAVDVVITPDYSVSDADFAVSVGYTDTDLSLVSGSTTVSASDLNIEADEAYILETLVFEVLDTCGNEATIEPTAGTWTIDGYNFDASYDEEAYYTYYPTYTITYSDGTESVTYTANDADITLPVLDADADGNAFLGWSYGGVVYTEIDTASAQDYNLTAVWDVTTTYTITYSESVGDDAVTSYTNKTTETITLPVLEKDDYTFDGWYEEDGTEAITTIDPATATDYNLTALWTEIVKAEMDLTVGLRADGYTADGDNNTYADIYADAGITFTGNNVDGYTLTVDEATWTAWVADEANTTALAAMQNSTKYYVGIQFADDGDKVISSVSSSSADADNHYIIYIPVANTEGCYVDYDYTYIVTYADGDTAEIKVARELIGAPVAIADGVVDEIVDGLISAINDIINGSTDAYGEMYWTTEDFTSGYSYNTTGDDTLEVSISDGDVTITAMYNDIADTMIDVLGSGSASIEKVQMGDSAAYSVATMDKGDVYNLVANSGLTGENGTSAISGNDTIIVLIGQEVDLVLTDVCGVTYTYVFSFVADESVETDDEPETAPVEPVLPGAGEGTTSGTDEEPSEDTPAGDAPSTGDTIEVVITPSSDDTDESSDETEKETVTLSVTIVTNNESTIGSTGSSDDTTVSGGDESGESEESDKTETTGYNALAENTQMIVLSVVVESNDNENDDTESSDDTSDESTGETEDEVDVEVEVEAYVPPTVENPTTVTESTIVEGYYYDGEPMYYSPLYEAYVYIYDETEGFDASKVTAGEAILLEYDGNISGDADGEVSALDATLVYRLSLGTSSEDYDTIDMKSRLEADVNGDGVVNFDDALYILKLTWDK